MKPEQNELIKYRIDKSNLNLQAAKSLIDIDNLVSCPRTLYYACFYIVNALLLTTTFTGKTHSGMRNHFYKEFIKTGIIEEEYGDSYSELFYFRQENDYDDIELPEKETIINYYKKSKQFIEKITILINEILQKDAKTVK